MEAEEATRLTTDEHRSRLTGAEAEAQTAERSTASTMSICDEALRCDDDDEELAVVTMTATDSVGYWVWFWFVYWGFFFFF